LGEKGGNSNGISVPSLGEEEKDREDGEVYKNDWIHVGGKTQYCQVGMRNEGN